MPRNGWVPSLLWQLSLVHYADPSLPLTSLSDDEILVLRVALLSTIARTPRSALELPERSTQLKVLTSPGTRKQDVRHEPDRAGDFCARGAAEGLDQMWHHSMRVGHFWGHTHGT